MSIPGYLPLAEAARQKRLPRPTLWRHVRLGHVDSVIVAGRIFVVENEKYRTFDIDRARQRDTIRGLRVRGKAKGMRPRPAAPKSRT
jgi:hypothetical protein